MQDAFSVQVTNLLLVLIGDLKMAQPIGGSAIRPIRIAPLRPSLVTDRSNSFTAAAGLPVGSDANPARLERVVN